MEARLVLSFADPILPAGLGSTLDLSTAQAGSSIIAVDPASNSYIDQGPSVFSVTFDRPLNSFSLGVADFQLIRVADDGTTTPVTGPQGSLFEELDPSDPTGSRILLTPGAALSDGRYRLLLSADNFLLTDDNQPVSASGVDLSLSTFNVGRRPTSVIDLGQAGPTVRSTDGVLDLASNTSAVGLYRLSVPEGHHWRLGLSVTTPDGLAPSFTVLSLFDSQGNLIETASSGHAGSVGDPFLFEGVSPGNYLVGISGPGNIPGTPSGYDPAQGLGGTSDSTAIGGAYRLQFVADIADQPTQVTGLRVDRGDPLSTVPTGLTIQFSGTIRVADLLNRGAASVVLVDASGASWGVTPIAYDETQARLSFLFDQQLPAGRYTLKLAEGGTLVDLAGLVPQAAGLPAGVLGNVEITAGSTRPDNLGALLPGVASTGLSSTVEVKAGGSIVRHFQVFESGVYTISQSGSQTRLTMTLTAKDGSNVSLTSDPNGSAEADGYLLAGSYTLELTNPEGSRFQGTIKVTRKSSSNESLLLGGIAQGSALNLRLVSPSTTLEQGVTEPVDTAPQTGVFSPVGGTPSPISNAETSSGPAATSSGIESRAIAEDYSGLVGRPSLVAQQISVVGPTGTSDSVALASNSDQLPGGVVVIPKLSSRKLQTSGQGLSQEAGPREIATQPADPTPEIDYGLISRDTDPGYDEQALDAATRWIDRIAAMGLERLEFLTGRTTSPIALTGDEATVDPSPIVAEAPGLPLEASRVETASIAPAVGIGVLVMIAYRYRYGAPAQAGRPRQVEVKTTNHPLFIGFHKPRATAGRFTARSGC